MMWTDEQVAKLNEFQRCGVMHPFTCGNYSGHRDLVATNDGWVCLDCEYTQDWAHDFMFLGAPPDLMELLRLGTKSGTCEAVSAHEKDR